MKQLRKLHQIKYRRSHQQFLLEGTHLVQEALATRYPLQAICATPAWHQQHPDLWDQLQASVSRLELVSTEVLTAITTTTTPDGVVAIAPYPESVAIPSTPPQLGLAVEGLQDPGNLGTLIRTAAAVGSDGLWLNDSCVDLMHPKVMRASAGQWFRVPKQVTVDLAATLSSWQGMGCQVLATVVNGGTPYWSVDLTQPTVVVVGNEGAGLSATVMATVNQAIAIPMAGEVESLNVGVAAAVILFEARRQRQYSTAT